MPIVSTIAGASLSADWKKKDLINDTSRQCCCCCCCCCRHHHYHHRHSHRECHKQQSGRASEEVVGAEKENSAEWLQETTATLRQRQQEQEQQQKQQHKKADAVRRAPFRSLNGKAYAVPLSMVGEFDAMLQRAQGSTEPEDGNTPLFLLSSPGILWRHDPYSTRVLAAKSFSQRQQSAVEDNEEFAGCAGGGDSGSGSRTNRMNVNEDKDVGWETTTLVTEIGGCPPPTYGSAMMNPMCIFHPVSSPFGSMPCFPVHGGMYSPALHSAFQQTHDGMMHAYGHFPDFDVITAAEDGGAKRLQNGEIVALASAPTAPAAGSVMPSARPVPTTPRRCVVIRSVPHPSSSLPTVSTPVSAPVAAVSATNTGATEMPTASQEREGSSQVSAEGNSPLSARKPRGSLGGGNDRYGDGLLDELPSTLRMFHSIPSFFTDLAAYTNHRPSLLKSKRTCDDGNQLRCEDVQYVYLVQHRCRRTVSAARVRYELDEMVVLEGDMGIEMGVVQAVLSMEEFGQLDATQLSQRGFPTGCEVVTAALIIRAATAEERAHYNQTLPRLSKDLLSFLQRRLNPANFVDCQVEHMEFLDCEFQADCKKVYVYYRARKRVLFRELAQYLHSFYHCRIWLHEVGRGDSTVSADSSQETAS